MAALKALTNAISNAPSIYASYKYPDSAARRTRNSSAALAAICARPC